MNQAPFRAWLCLALHCVTSSTLAQDVPSSSEVASQTQAPSESATPQSPQEPAATRPDEQSPAQEVGPNEIDAQISAGTLAAPSSGPSVEEQAAVSELLRNEQTTSDADVPRKIDIYGFADFSYRQWIISDSSPWQILPEQGRAQLLVGNLNVYLRTQISRDFTSLAEVRFHFRPLGEQVNTAKAAMDPSVPSVIITRSTDQNEFDRPFNYGSIEIERVHIDYTPHALLTLRAGRFLTPYGIWNVDHGSPVVLLAFRPYIIGESLFPEAQTGVEVLGSHTLRNGDLGYHLTVSNGRGPIEAVGDMDKNKALGGRLWFTTRRFGELTLGGSAYFGRYTEKRVRVKDPNGKTPDAQVEWFNWESYRELGLAADLRFQYRGWSLLSEVVTQQRVWDDDARPPSNNLYQGAPGSQVDHVRWGSYGIVGYRFDWLGVMPFLTVEYYDSGVARTLGGSNNVVGIQAGVNARVVPSVALKLQGGTSFFPNAQTGTLARSRLPLVAIQVAWAF